MIISFFEEYPTKKNLSRLKHVTWKTKLYLAAKTQHEFLSIVKNINNTSLIECIWWPILKEREGYWISSFTKRAALKRVLDEAKDLPVMIDAELPTHHNPWLYLTQFFNFLRNRRLIREFIKSHGKVYCAEYYPQGKSKDKILSFLGLHFDPNQYRCSVIKMMYHSMHSFSQNFVEAYLSKGVKKYKERFMVGYGTIATGVTGKEPLLSLGQLEVDLALAKKAGVREVVVFRLGGLTKEYATVMKRYVKE